MKVNLRNVLGSVLLLSSVCTLALPSKASAQGLEIYASATVCNHTGYIVNVRPGILDEQLTALPAGKCIKVYTGILGETTFEWDENIGIGHQKVKETLEENNVYNLQLGGFQRTTVILMEDGRT